MTETMDEKEQLEALMKKPESEILNHLIEIHGKCPQGCIVRWFISCLDARDQTIKEKERRNHGTYRTVPNLRSASYQDLRGHRPRLVSVRERAPYHLGW
jgi:hypothetical protein